MPAARQLPCAAPRYEWISARVCERLHLAVLVAYDRVFGLKLDPSGGGWV
jgi:hypothetical protein